MRFLPRLVALAAAAASVSPLGASVQARRAGQALPARVLWAWERPSDLRSLPQGTGVALLAQSIYLRNDRFEVRPRRQPLHVDETTPLIAVTRIEPAVRPAAPDNEQVAQIAGRIALTADLPQVVAIQIDFDATAGERAFYRRLLRAVRQRLPARVPLSMTALASWCAGDRWLDDLPVDEAVPMLFQMASVDESYAAMAVSSRAAAPSCRGALGVSLDEPVAMRPDRRRIYVFNPGPWTAASIARATEVGR